jgi:hypothetical protein
MQWLSVMALNLGFSRIHRNNGTRRQARHILLVSYPNTYWFDQNLHLLEHSPGLAQKILLRRRLRSHKMPSNEGMRI